MFMGAADLRNCMHIDGDVAAATGTLQTWAPLGSLKASLFCWLTPSGVEHGKLLLDKEKRPPTDLELLDLGQPIPVQDAMSEGITSMVRLNICPMQHVLTHPQSEDSMLLTSLSHAACVYLQVMTQFHVLLLSQRAVHVFSLVSGHAVQEVALSAHVRQLPQSPFLAMVRDPEAATIYLVAGPGLLKNRMRRRPLC
jgi:hypothetical protein